METVEYYCLYDGHNYTVYIAHYTTYLKPISITVQNDIHILQTFTYIGSNKTIISYTSPSLSHDFFTILLTCLHRLKYPFPDEFSQSFFEVPIISFTVRRTIQYNDTLIFTTATHSFRATIKEEPYNISVKIGGRDFVGCVELFIDKPNISFYKAPKLAQVYSEPGCWFQLGKKGKIVDLLKGSFQLCQMLFGVNNFCLNDNSNVECGITNMSQKSPRKLEKPFSLAHLSIAEKGKTWYEIHFNAFIHDTTHRASYKEAIKGLQNTDIKHTNDFEEFAAINRLRKDQYDILKPLYIKSSTWLSFFRKIPKEIQCTTLFNWLPEYMDKYILHFQPTKHEWCICLEPLGIFDKEVYSDIQMERTDVMIQMVPETIQQWGGGKHQCRRNTCIQETVCLSFSNQY